MNNIQHSTMNTERRARTVRRTDWKLDVDGWALNVFQFILVHAIRFYQFMISPALVLLFGPSGGCRFTPTCSQYALDAVRTHGALTGTSLAARRICRCHPWGGCGHDPVPENEFGIQDSEFRI